MVNIHLHINWRLSMAQRAIILSAICVGIIPLASCNDDISSGNVNKSMEKYTKSLGEEEFCLNKIKVKPYWMNYHNRDRLGTYDSTLSMSIPEDAIVFSEEAFLQWRGTDLLILTLLMANGYINIYSGGYERSMGDRNHPGDVIDFSSANNDNNRYALINKTINQIKTKGAVATITEKGRDAGLETSEDGTCMTAKWALQSVSSWTPANVDASGRNVAHIKARLKLVPMRVAGVATDSIKYDYELYVHEGEYLAVLKNTGWEIENGVIEGDVNGDIMPAGERVSRKEDSTDKIEKSDNINIVNLIEAYGYKKGDKIKDSDIIRNVDGRIELKMKPNLPNFVKHVFVDYAEETGICSVSLYSEKISTNSNGDEIDSLFSRINDAITNKYGIGYNRLDPFSKQPFQKKDGEWMASKERHGGYYRRMSWRKKDEVILQGGLNEISIDAFNIDNNNGAILIDYFYDNYEKCIGSPSNSKHE